MAGIVAVGHVGVRTRDLEKLTAFYRDVVGLRLTVAYPGVVAIFEVGDVDVFLEPGEPGEIGFDLAADEVDAFRKRLVDAGVECAPAKSSGITGHRSFTFTDPDGNAISVMNAHPRTHGGPLRRRRSWSQR